MTEYSDGQLLWITHFDRQNYTAKWVKEAEQEMLRRNLRLHKISADTQLILRHKPITAAFDDQSLNPYPERKTWWREILIGLGIIPFEKLLARHFPWIITSLLIGLISGILLYKISRQDTSSVQKIFVWLLIGGLIVLGYFL